MEEIVENLFEEVVVIVGIFSQYFIGVDNWVFIVESYLFDEVFNMNFIWQDFYNGFFNVFNIIIEKLEVDGVAYYVGVVKVLMVFNLGIVVFFWGDIFYMQAFQGGANFSLFYDLQEIVYVEV